MKREFLFADCLVCLRVLFLIIEDIYIYIDIWFELLISENYRPSDKIPNINHYCRLQIRVTYRKSLDTLDCILHIKASLAEFVMPVDNKYIFCTWKRCYSSFPIKNNWTLYTDLGLALLHISKRQVFPCAAWEKQLFILQIWSSTTLFFNRKLKIFSVEKFTMSSHQASQVSSLRTASWCWEKKTLAVRHSLACRVPSAVVPLPLAVWVTLRNPLWAIY